MGHEAKVEVGWGASAVKTGLKEMRDDMKKTREEFNEKFSVVQLLAVGGAIEKVIEGLHEMVEEAMELSHMSERFGVSAQSLQRIGNAAKEGGVGLEGVGTAMNKLIINQQKAKEGGEEQRKALAALKISTEEYFNLDPEEAFYRLADGVKGCEDPMEAYNAIVVLLGKNGGTLIPTLRRGGEEIRAMGNAAGVMSDETIENLAEAGHKWEATMHQIKVWTAETFTWISKAAKEVGLIIGTVGAMFTGTSDKDAGAAYEAGHKEIWEPKHEEKEKGPVRDAEAGNEEKEAMEKQKKLAEEVAKIHERIKEQQREAWREQMDAESRINDLIEERELLYVAAQGIHRDDAKAQAEDWLKAGELEKRIMTEREKVDKEAESKQEKLLKAKEKFEDKVFEGDLAQMDTEQQIQALMEKRKKLQEEINGSEDSTKTFDLMTQYEELSQRILKLATPKEAPKDDSRLVTSTLGRLTGGGYLSKADPSLLQLEQTKKSNDLLKQAYDTLRKIEEKVGRPTWQP